MKASLGSVIMELVQVSEQGTDIITLGELNWQQQGSCVKEGLEMSCVNAKTRSVKRPSSVLGGDTEAQARAGVQIQESRGGSQSRSQLDCGPTAHKAF